MRRCCRIIKKHKRAMGMHIKGRSSQTGCIIRWQRDIKGLWRGVKGYQEALNDNGNLLNGDGAALKGDGNTLQSHFNEFCRRPLCVFVGLLV